MKLGSSDLGSTDISLQPTCLFRSRGVFFYYITDLWLYQPRYIRQLATTDMLFTVPCDVGWAEFHCMYVILSWRHSIEHIPNHVSSIAPSILRSIKNLYDKQNEVPQRDTRNKNDRHLTGLNYVNNLWNIFFAKHETFIIDKSMWSKP